MSKQDLNQLTGHDFFQARENIGITMKVVYERLGINRNKLSQFEQEKGTLPTNEKRALKRFYEERGHDFGDAEPIDGDSIKVEYEASKVEVAESIDSLMPNETGEALISYIDSVHDVLTANGYLDDLTHQTTEQKPVMPKQYNVVMNDIVEHFTLDKSGEFEKKTGLLGDSASNRGRKVMAHLAYLKLQELHNVSPDIFDVSLTKATNNSDNKRLLVELKDYLDADVMKELNQHNGDLVK